MPVYPVNGLGKYPVYTDTGQLHELPAGGLLLPCQSQEHMLRPDAATPRMARLSRCLAQNPPRAWGQALRQPQARRSSAPQSRRHQPQCLRLEARAPQYPPCQGIRLG